MKSLITLVALGFTGVALAQEPLPPFEETDSNQDGQISRTEAAAVEGLDFDTADADQNGSLDRTEYMAAASSQGEGGRSGQGGEPGQGGQPGQPSPPSPPGQPDQGLGGADSGAPGSDPGQRN